MADICMNNLFSLYNVTSMYFFGGGEHLVYFIQMKGINLSLYHKNTERASIWNKFKVAYAYIG